MTAAFAASPGRTDAEPAAVIVQRYRLSSVRVRFAHARCADSQIVEADAETPDPAAMGGMLAKAAVLEYASEPRVRALLILEPAMELSERSAGGEQRNLLISGLLEQGFTVLRTGGENPRPADGWLVQLTPDAARLLAPDGSVAYEGGLVQPRPWLKLVRRAHACVVLIGTIGMYASPGEEMTAQNLRRLLDQAARAGELAAAVVTTDA
jgi:hypothetical protein